MDVRRCAAIYNESTEENKTGDDVNVRNARVKLDNSEELSSNGER
jgi:hypothetical protein